MTRPPAKLATISSSWPCAKPEGDRKAAKSTKRMRRHQRGKGPLSVERIGKRLNIIFLTTGLTLSHPRDRNRRTILQVEQKSYLTAPVAYSSNGARAAMATKIQGIEGMKHGELEFELQGGAKFVLFHYCVSVIVVTFRRPADIYFVR